MLTGQSVWHVNQDLGKCFSNEDIKGYYNNLTEKVTKIPELLGNTKLPKLEANKGDYIDFPVAIFQYGLGAYDLFLMTNDERYMIKFQQCVEWACLHQDEKGRWNNFFYIFPEHPYGAMAQGEGVSLLIRAYKSTGRKHYLTVAKKAIDYMLQSIEKGGTTHYLKDEILFLEYTHRNAVMNGWIFAWWGLWDYVIVTKDSKYKEILDKSCDTLVKYLPLFSNSYWSMYDLGGRIASPFYHNLHVAQMQAMYMLTGRIEFDQYANKWGGEQKKSIAKLRAFLKKACQKILE